MTPDANDLCVFAVKRGDIEKRIDINYNLPKYIEFVKSFPMNAAGKVLKYKMREEAAARLGLVGDGSNTAGPAKK